MDTIQKLSIRLQIPIDSANVHSTPDERKNTLKRIKCL